MSLENLHIPEEEEGWNESMAPYHIFSIKTIKKDDLRTSLKDGHVSFLPDVTFFEFQILSLPLYYKSLASYFMEKVQSRSKSHMDYGLSNSDTKFPFKKECDGKLFDIFHNLCIGEFDSNRNSILGIYHCLIYCLKWEKQDANEKDIFNSIKQEVNSAISNDSEGQQPSVNLCTDFDNSLLYCLKKMSKIRISVESDCDPKTLQVISNLMEYPFKSTTALDLNDDELLNIDERYMVRSLNYFARFQHFLNAVYFKKNKLKNYSRILTILDFLTYSIETVILSLVFMKESGSGNPRAKLNLFCLAENMIMYIEEIVRSVLSVVDIMEIEETLHHNEPYMEKVLIQIFKKGLTDEEISSFIHDLCIQCSRFQGGRSVACFSTISNIAALLEEVRIK